MIHPAVKVLRKWLDDDRNSGAESIIKTLSKCGFDVVKNDKINYFSIRNPNIGQRFVAMYEDGSGATLMIRTKNENGWPGFKDAMGEELDIGHLEPYSCWLPLPDDFRLWFEKKEEKL